MDSSTIVAPAQAPSATSPGFKDWAVVCAALLRGRQSVILRKGGIAEGRDGFRFKHEDFFLFPTQYHQQLTKVRDEEARMLTVPTPPPERTIEIQAFCRMEWAVWIDEWSVLAGLGAFHIYREEVLRERFEYGDERGLQLAFGRVYHLRPSWAFPDKPGYGGCRSWVQLPSLPAAITMEPAIGEERHHEVAAGLRAALGSFAAGLPEGEIK